MTVDLGAVVSEAARKHGGSWGDYSVLAATNDPYRQDTPTRRRHAEWLMETVEGLGVYQQRPAIHCRGLHYVLLGQTLPNGKPYLNTHNQWKALVEWAGAARWLGIIPFERIIDERSDPPTVRAATRRSRGYPYISAGVAVTIDAEFEPVVGLYGDAVQQSHRIVLMGYPLSAYGGNM